MGEVEPVFQAIAAQVFLASDRRHGGGIGGTVNNAQVCAVDRVYGRQSQPGI